MDDLNLECYTIGILKSLEKSGAVAIMCSNSVYESFSLSVTVSISLNMSLMMSLISLFSMPCPPSRMCRDNY